MVELSIQFKIITEYVEPNFENIYPDNLIQSLEPISFKAQFGESYYFTITGDSISGYIIRMDGNGLNSTAVETKVADELEEALPTEVEESENEYTVDKTEEITSEGNYPGADVVEIVNLRGDKTTVYKLADGTYMDRIERRFSYNGTDTWIDEDGVEWNEVAKNSTNNNFSNNVDEVFEDEVWKEDHEKKSF